MFAKIVCEVIGCNIENSAKMRPQRHVLLHPRPCQLCVWDILYISSVLIFCIYFGLVLFDNILYLERFEKFNCPYNRFVHRHILIRPK